LNRNLPILDLTGTDSDPIQFLRFRPVFDHRCEQMEELYPKRKDSVILCLHKNFFL